MSTDAEEGLAYESALRLRVARRAAEDPALEEARRLLAEGDAEAAHALIERKLEEEPWDDEAGLLADECCAAIEQEAIDIIGPLTTIPRVAVSGDELMRLGLDALSGFLLSLIDGQTDVDTLLDLCGPRRLAALRALRDLVVRGVVRPTGAR
jgi:hypothetical protein